MPRDCWCVISTFIHFASNQTADADGEWRKVVRPLLKMITNRFLEAYTPWMNISIDEELVVWCGQLPFRQYILSKRARFGIKVFALCESSGYMSNFIVYTLGC
eukprot:scpid106035/ scgid9430/ PiggyBac transposable element-derived protein 4